MNFGFGGGNCECLIWILLLLCCMNGGSTYGNGGCGCILPILLILCCTGNTCGGCGKC